MTTEDYCKHSGCFLFICLAVWFFFNVVRTHSFQPFRDVNTKGTVNSHSHPFLDSLMGIQEK